jgi:hypothetical protein
MRNCPKTPTMEKAGEEGWQQPRRGRTRFKSKGPRTERGNPNQTKDRGNHSDKGEENSFRILGQENSEEKEEENGREEIQTEETNGNQALEVGGNQGPTEEEEQRNSSPTKEASPDIEEGEVSSESEDEGASDARVTPKKTGRGRKSKKKKETRKPTETS